MSNKTVSRLEKQARKYNTYKVANPALGDAMRALRFSSAAQPHDNRPNRQRTRTNIKRAAIAESAR